MIFARVDPVLSPSKGKSVGQQLIKNDPGGVNVRARINRLIPELLGRHVVQTSDDLPGSGERVIPQAGNAEIDNLDASVIQHHDVAGLNVPMYDPALVCVSQPLADLDDDVDFFHQRHGRDGRATELPGCTPQGTASPGMVDFRIRPSRKP